MPLIKLDQTSHGEGPVISQDGRGQPNTYTLSERAMRGLWKIFYWTVYRWVPRSFNGWHRLALRWFGAEVGTDVLIYPTALIECPWNLSLADHCVVGAEVRLYALGRIRIGSHSVVSQRAFLCAGSHDYSDPRMSLLRPPITIGAGVWICTEAFVGPGSSVGDRCVVGARSVVTGDLPPDMVCAGNPCRPIKRRVMRSP
jgi:putative colanic acid biosynthesis acetyltransferase WcaF